MTPAETYRQWDDLDLEARVAALEDVANDYLVNNGYDNVDVQVGQLDDAFAETDPDIGDIVIDGQALETATADQAMDMIYHETWHSMDAQDGVFDRLPEDERASLNETEGYEWYYDDQGELQVREPYAVPEHDNADAFGAAMAEQVALEAAGGGAAASATAVAATESASDTFQVEILWDQIVVSNAGDDTFEPDFDHAVITTEPSSDAADNPGGAADYFEGGHAVPSP